ncbi:MAG: HAD family phosphatase [Ardenticatenaceae bacterium]|nr:HAD family phosphatase [Ardenticatenaceae bacterium]
MKAVIFDLGGVLVNYDGRSTFTEIAQLARTTLDDLFPFYQKHDHTFGTGQLSGQDYYQKLNEAFGFSADYETFVTTFCRTQQRNEAALAFACDLQARPNVRVGIISNTNQVHAGWLRENLPEFKQFHSVILSNEVGLLKPDSAIYELSLKQLEVPPAQALFVDDAEENLVGGTAVNLHTLHHTNWQHTRPAIEQWLKS